MEEEHFEICKQVNDQLILGQESQARNELIKLLDDYNKRSLEYDPLVNHLIRETGLYPYMDLLSSNWDDRYVHEAFKVDIGEKEKVTLHREQSLLLKKLLGGNDIAVSAPTSFGKSFVIDAFISIQRPKNVMIIVPTIALTDETRRRLFKKFSNDYKIITTTEVPLGEKNLFIFPQERAIKYLSTIENIDILIVDEFYKASSNFDKERAPSLVKAIIELGEKASQKYYLAPNISDIEDNPFTKGMEFCHFNFNTVFLEKHELFNEINGDEEKKGSELIRILDENEGKTLIYAGTYSNIKKISTIFLSSYYSKTDNQLLTSFSEWLSKNYGPNWALPKLVKMGVGLHNGSLHRSLSQIQIKLFEEDSGLNTIISTSSIIEGVNTSAKNVILWMNKKGNAKLDDFTYKNIIGRGGRMLKHFVGKIFILDSPPKEEETQLDLPFPEELLGDIDQEKFDDYLSEDEHDKIEEYQNEMNGLINKDDFLELKNNNQFQNNNYNLIRDIARDMYHNPREWNGLNFLNSRNVDDWDRMLYKIIKFQPSGWDGGHKKMVEFTKVIRLNWLKSIPELLEELESFDVDIEDFFKLERNLTFKLSSLLNDVNLLQKSILKDKSNDISRMIFYTSNAFLPPVVYQLEEFGLPRMISKKIQNSEIVDFYDSSLKLHDAIYILNSYSFQALKEKIQPTEFEEYIISYFLAGIKKE